MDSMRIGKDVAVATYDEILPALSEDESCTDDGMRLASEKLLGSPRQAARFRRKNSPISRSSTRRNGSWK
jgi:hypothetical protein